MEISTKLNFAINLNQRAIRKKFYSALIKSMEKEYVSGMLLTMRIFFRLISIQNEHVRVIESSSIWNGNAFTSFLIIMRRVLSI